MAATLRSSTPPPTRARTPQTPRWGVMSDEFQPYSPRKSARISQLAHGSATPHRSSRDFINSASTPSTSSLTSTPSSPQTARKRIPRQSSSEMGGRRISGALTKDSAITAASALGLPAPKEAEKIAAHQSTTAVRNNGMLPTPAKTPKKRPEEIAPAITSVARNLFSIRPNPDDIMPSPRKGRKRYTGLTLASFEAEEDSTPIQIFTDSNDKVPEIDNSPENPFYGQSSSVPSEPTKRSSKRRKVAVTGEGEHEIEDLEDREDGLVYVFRGKKVFRKFSDQPDHEEADRVNDTATETSVSPPSRVMTRSAIKPRLLFPPTKPAQASGSKLHTTDDEEADTDIEDRDEVFTPTAQVNNYSATPKAPKFGPFTPPTTVRATRSKKVDMSSSPIRPDTDDEMVDYPTSPIVRGSRIGGAALFDEWSRGRSSTKDSKKRGSEDMNSASRGGAKKLRS